MSARGWAATAAIFGSMAFTSCVERSEIPDQTYRLVTTLKLADGSALPPESQPLCLDLRGLNPECPDGQSFLLSVQALDNSGNLDTSFNGYVRVTVRPGTVASVSGDASDGRNIRLHAGKADDQLVHLIGTFGPTRIEVQDLGYLPADPTAAKKPACADGIDNNGNGLIDYPADPGCEFANDDSEDFGTAAAGVSPTIWYRYPSVPDAQGYGRDTPFQSEGVVMETRADHGSNLIVTRVLSQGFIVSDVTTAADGTLGTKDYGSLYVFNFGLPAGIRNCDRVTYLAGSMDVFFGYTEMNFPSYDVHPWSFDMGGDGPCQIPPPIVLTKGHVSSKANAAELQKYMSSMVRVDGAHISTHFGPGHPMTSDLPNGDANCGGMTKFTFDQDHSNCDLNDDGTTNFSTDTDEANCFCFCFNNDPDCSEWSGYRSRGNFRLILDSTDATQSIQANVQSVENFDPRAYVGQVLPHLTGTLSKFSGGSLNWTIEARCTDDLIYCPLVKDPTTGALVSDPVCAAAPPDPMSVETACVKPRTAADNDSASN